MSNRAMGPCPADSELMKAWNGYKETDDFKNSTYWALTETRMRPERAEELNVPPEANRTTPQMRQQHVEGSLWAAFMAGFGAAGGKITF